MIQYAVDSRSPILLMLASDDEFVLKLALNEASRHVVRINV